MQQPLNANTDSSVVPVNLLTLNNSLDSIFLDMKNSLKRKDKIENKFRAIFNRLIGEFLHNVAKSTTLPESITTAADNEEDPPDIHASCINGFLLARRIRDFTLYPMFDHNFFIENHYIIPIQNCQPISVLLAVMSYNIVILETVIGFFERYISESEDQVIEQIKTMVTSTPATNEENTPIFFTSRQIVTIDKLLKQTLHDIQSVENLEKI